MQSDIQDWRITFADTGVDSNIAQRLKNIQPYLEKDEVFLATYSDGLTDFPLPRLLEQFKKKGVTAAFLCVKPNISYHFVSVKDDGLVTSIYDVNQSSLRINGGYFVFRRDIFNYIREGEELVYEPFQRLIAKQELVAMNYDGFYGSMDTFKDKQYLTGLYVSGKAPWEVWKGNGVNGNHALFAAKGDATMESAQLSARS
jgi:glucose-1-phosphate cytidylyltransferase